MIRYENLNFTLLTGRTGTGSEETVAHSLNRIPDLVECIVDDSSSATYTFGTHTATAALVTVTADKTYALKIWG